MIDPSKQKDQPPITMSLRGRQATHPLSRQADSSPMLRTGEPCFPFRRDAAVIVGVYCGTVSARSLHWVSLFVGAIHESPDDAE